MSSIRNLFSQDEVTLMFMDIGLGGLAIMDEIHQTLKKPGGQMFAKAHLVYYNVQVNEGAPEEFTKRPLVEQIEIFDKALEAGMINHHPDLIMIACNSLSVIYHDTLFKQTEVIPVIDIIRFGVDLFNKSLTTYQPSYLIVFGTATTAKVAQHKKHLVKDNISTNRVVMQPVHDGATIIQNCGVESSETASVIDKHVRQAVMKLFYEGLITPDTHLIGGLCCTHYGFGRVPDLFNESLRNALSDVLGMNGHGVGSSLEDQVHVIVPDSKMAQFLFDSSLECESKCDECEVDVKVFTRVVLTQNEKKIAEYLGEDCGTALHNYVYDDELFCHPLLDDL